jgi:glycosyltransferase involved in cell wall biosynthesis
MALAGDLMFPSPKVSFVVPCYNLGHLLPECVNSILNQTYRDFEVLIMDDCSPDNTESVAKSFKDPRVFHVRNDHNLGHLCNYNKGITMSRGEYVWLISADDYLRKPYILERYVELMESHPAVGYACCSGVSVKNGEETEVLKYSVYDTCDRIVNGRTFLKRLLNQNIVLAASAMARRECYEKISLFPLKASWGERPVDMGWIGDWYLWCMFALFTDVAYFAEPMVSYREHDLSMTETVTRQENIERCSESEIGMLWMIRNKARELGLSEVCADCLSAVAYAYAQHCASKQYRRSVSSMTIDQFEQSLVRSTDNEQERNWIRARFFAGIADEQRVRGDSSTATRFYLTGLKRDPRMPKVYVKLLLIHLGKPGEYLLSVLRSLRVVCRSIM